MLFYDSDMQIQFIRHCETEWNRLEKCQGVSDIELNDNGIYQSNLLSKFYYDKNLDLIFSSDLKRAIQTSEAINKGPNCRINKDKNLREMDQGDFEGLTFSHLRKNYSNELQTWRKNPKDFRIPNGETLGEVQSRMIIFTENIFKKFNYLNKVVVVSHNLAISSMLCYYLHKDLKEFSDFTIDSGSISTLEYYNEKVKVVELNYIKHLNKND